MTTSQAGLQLKELIQKVEEFLPDGEFCQPYTVEYLKKTNRLLILHKATGKGDITIFDPDSVQCILNYLNRNREKSHG